MGLHALKSLRESFAKVSRQAALTLAMLGGSLLYGDRAAAQKAPAQPDTANTVAANANLAFAQQRDIIPKDSVKPGLTFRQMLNINEELDARGRMTFWKFLYDEGNQYSRSLDSLETRLRGYESRQNKGARERIAVMDPLMFDIGVGLGISPVDVVTKMLVHDGISPHFRTSLGVAMSLQRIRVINFVDDTLSTQFPSTFSPQDIFGNQARIIVPISDFMLSLHIPGLSRQEMVEFTNRHEGWHAIDYVHSDDDVNYDSLRANPPVTVQDMINNVEYMKSAAYHYNSEVYADVGAAGDMVRAGKGLDLIDNVIDWRALHPDDPRHMSPPVLTELKKCIEKMGLDAFRALDETQTTAVYDSVMQSAGMNVRRLQLAYEFMALEKEDRLSYLVLHQNDPEFSRAYAFARRFIAYHDNDNPEAEVKTVQKVPVDIQAAIDSVGNWDARTALEKEAIRTDGMVTRVSMAKAYLTMMQDFDEKLNQATTPAERISAGLHMSRLKSVYINVMEDINLVVTNMRYGIDMLEKDPSLKEAADRARPPSFNHEEIRVIRLRANGP